jgi:hypothetical protein
MTGADVEQVRASGEIKPVLSSHVRNDRLFGLSGAPQRKRNDGDRIGGNGRIDPEQISLVEWRWRQYDRVV